MTIEHVKRVKTPQQLETERITKRRRDALARAKKLEKVPLRRSPTWMDEGLCLSTDPGVFDAVGQHNDLALALCRDCPVLRECEKWTYESPELPIGVIQAGKKWS